MEGHGVGAAFLPAAYNDPPVASLYSHLLPQVGGSVGENISRRCP